MMAPRTIRLRRPPSLVMAGEGPFVPDIAEAMTEVDARWEARRREKPWLFDGRVCHVLGVHRNGHGGAVIHAIDCAYRFYAVQEPGFDLGVRPLGVKGILRRGDRVLIGRRSAGSARYAGLWEFVPGGMVTPGESPEQVIGRELAEETGLECGGPPTAIAIGFDPVVETWEIIYRIEARMGEVRAGPGEHDQLLWCQLDELVDRRDLSAIALRMLSLALRRGSPAG